jgi:hypothetical protein
MSAAEVIEEIKKLPPDEVRAVQEYLQRRSGQEPTVVEYITLEETAKSAEKFFRRYPDLFRKLAQ